MLLKRISKNESFKSNKWLYSNAKISSSWFRENCYFNSI